MLRRVINAWGTATPYGVSRSDPAVAAAVAQMLGRYVVMEELQALAAQRIAAWSTAPAACVTHCTAAGVTLAVAACMAGSDPDRVARLPDTTGMSGRVLLLAAHQVNYGQPIVQAVRLAGATPVVCADLDDVRRAAGQPGTAAVLAVESHLAAGSGGATTAALLRIARAAGVPLVLDAAAQDLRVHALVAGGADLVLVSAQKYLRAPTAGLVLGRADLVAAVQAQQGGIGRAMKPTKEALAGVIAAIDVRERLPVDAWRAAQQRRLDTVQAASLDWRGIRAAREPDPQGNGFDRLWLSVDAAVAGVDAPTLVQRLCDGDPAVAVAPHRAARGQIGLELSGVDDGETQVLCDLIAAALRG